MKRDAIIIAVFFALCLLLAQLAKGVTCEWKPLPVSWVAGYRIYAATNSVHEHHLTNAPVCFDCGTNTVWALEAFQSDTYLVVTAYTADGQESLPSNEVIFHVPFPALELMVHLEHTDALGDTNEWKDVGLFRLRIEKAK